MNAARAADCAPSPSSDGQHASRTARAWPAPAVQARRHEGAAACARSVGGSPPASSMHSAHRPARSNGPCARGMSARAALASTGGREPGCHLDRALPHHHPAKTSPAASSQTGPSTSTARDRRKPQQRVALATLLVAVAVAAVDGRDDGRRGRAGAVQSPSPRLPSHRHRRGGCPLAQQSEQARRLRTTPSGPPARYGLAIARARTLRR